MTELTFSKDENLRQIEELNRYETIIDSYLVRTNDEKTGELKISTPKLSSNKDVNYVFNIISETRDLIGRLRLPQKNNDNRRVSAKMNFLEEQVYFYERNLRSLSPYQLEAYAELLDILEREEQENKK